MHIHIHNFLFKLLIVTYSDFVIMYLVSIICILRWEIGKVLRISALCTDQRGLFYFISLGVSLLED